MENLAAINELCMNLKASQEKIQTLTSSIATLSHQGSDEIVPMLKDQRLDELKHIQETVLVLTQLFVQGFQLTLQVCDSLRRLVKLFLVITIQTSNYLEIFLLIH